MHARQPLQLSCMSSPRVPSLKDNVGFTCVQEVTAMYNGTNPRCSVNILASSDASPVLRLGWLISCLTFLTAAESHHLGRVWESELDLQLCLDTYKLRVLGHITSLSWFLPAEIWNTFPSLSPKGIKKAIEEGGMGWASTIPSKYWVEMKQPSDQLHSGQPSICVGCLLMPFLLYSRALLLCENST